MTTLTDTCQLSVLSEHLRAGKQGLWHYDYPLAPKWITYSSLGNKVDAMRAEFDRFGLRSGDRLGLKGNNHPEWIAADIAALAMGLIVVPLVEDMVIEELDRFVETYDLQVVLLIGNDGKWPERPWLARLGRPEAHLVRRAPMGLPFEDDIVTLVFSSGTAGTRKCLAIRSTGIERTIKVMTEGWHIDEQDNILVALPLSGLQQRILVYTAILADCQFSLADPLYLLKVMRQANPTIVVGPPSFYEPLEARWKSLPEASRQLALNARHRGAEDAKTVSALPTVVRDLLETFGQHPRHLVVGSAPVRPALLATYRLLGLPLYEVYGITEFGWVTFNTPEGFRDGTVGRTVPGVRIELQPDGEIVLHGDRPQCQRYVVSGESEQYSTFLREGGIATGDLGKVDDDGFVHLVGRKKNVIISRSGYKISPEELETWLEQRIDCVRSMVMMPEHAHSLHAIVWLHRPTEEQVTRVSQTVLELSRRRPSPERIVQVLVRDAGELCPELGTLTRNLKLNRQGVLRYLASPQSANSTATITGNIHA